MSRYSDRKVDMDSVRDNHCFAVQHHGAQRIRDNAIAEKYVIQNVRRDLKDEGVVGVDDISDELLYGVIESARDLGLRDVDETILKMVIGEY